MSKVKTYTQLQALYPFNSNAKDLYPSIWLVFLTKPINFYHANLAINYKHTSVENLALQMVKIKE